LWRKARAYSLSPSSPLGSDDDPSVHIRCPWQRAIPSGRARRPMAVLPIGLDCCCCAASGPSRAATCGISLYCNSSGRVWCLCRVPGERFLCARAASLRLCAAPAPGDDWATPSGQVSARYGDGPGRLRAPDGLSVGLKPSSSRKGPYDK
jgi:hypothetical protein